MTDVPIDIRRRKRLRIAVLAVFCLLFAALAWKGLALLNAQWAYNDSRPFPHGGPNSFEFLSRGIGAGDSETMVDQKLTGAVVMSGRSPTAPGFGTTMKFYEFHYGRGILFTKGRPLLREWVCVYFDAEGNAEVIEHRLIGDSVSKQRRLNLLSKSIESLDQ